VHHLAFTKGTVSDDLVEAADRARLRRQPSQEGEFGTFWLDSQILSDWEADKDVELVVAVDSSMLDVDLGNATLLLRLIQALPGSLAKAASAHLVAASASVSRTEVSLSAEVTGMSVGKGGFIEAPEVLGVRTSRLERTSLKGRRVEDLTGGELGDAYSLLVSAWTRTLLESEVLQVGLRRDTAVMTTTGVGSLRWAGTRRASGVVREVAAQVIAAPPGDDVSPAVQRLATTLADAWGSAQPLVGLASLALGVLPGRASLGGSRVIGELAAATQESTAEHEDVLLLLRQMVNLRDIGERLQPSAAVQPWAAAAKALR
jgi:hypothetical protein